jgi:hypothetical protein
MVYVYDIPTVIYPRPQGWPSGFRSGDITRMETTQGPMTMRILELDDPDWLEIRWDFPHPPDESL